MKIKFIKPLPQIDHVIPAGHILDAAPGFAQKMIRLKYAEIVSEAVVNVVAEPTAKAKTAEPDNGANENLTAFELALKAAHAVDEPEKVEDSVKETVEASADAETEPEKADDKPAEKKPAAPKTRKPVARRGK